MSQLNIQNNGAGRIPSLDGLRAVSIFLVMFSHWAPNATSSLVGAFPLNQYRYFGSLGVSIFFVISGFLITSLLLSEKERTSTIDIGSFYLRRAFRILPAYYVFLAAMVVLSYTHLAIPFRDFVAAALFARDYELHASRQLDHTWSLSVEEQFYLLWPLLVSRLGRNKLVWLCLTIMALCPLCRVITYWAAPSMREGITVMFHTRADSLMTGCLLALIHRTRRCEHWFRYLVALRVPGFAVGIVLIMSPALYSIYHDGYLLAAGYTVGNILIAIILLFAVKERNSIAAKALNWRPIAYIGTLSYSLYLWHLLFIRPHQGAFGTPMWYSFLFALAAAWLSFTLVEKPFLVLRSFCTDRRGKRGTPRRQTTESSTSAFPVVQTAPQPVRHQCELQVAEQ